jgi:hypothetical protein
MRCLLDKVIALATFGTVPDGSILGMHYLATFDQPMLNNWLHQQEKIQARLKAMCHDLPEPYCYATLPQLVRPEQIQ